MGFWEVVLIGIGLSMDAVAVSVSNGMVFGATPKRKLWLMPLFFGLFQAIMPVAGYCAGGLFADFLSRYAGIVIFLILGVIGGKMIYDGVHSEQEKKAADACLRLPVLLMQALLTSIDALAVGVGFAATGVTLLPAAALIGLITLLCSGAALLAGKRCAAFLGNKAHILGGIILVLIGVKSLFS